MLPLGCLLECGAYGLSFGAFSDAGTAVLARPSSDPSQRFVLREPLPAGKCLFFDGASRGCRDLRFRLIDRVSSLVWVNVRGMNWGSGPRLFGEDDDFALDSRPNLNGTNAVDFLGCMRCDA